MSISDNLKAFKMELDPIGIQLIAISKTKPVEMIGEAYEAGQRAFGENVVQEMVEKQALLPADIQWHMVGHLQRSEEHTSELQSLMRISYAVFCLKKKNNQN